MLLDLDRMIALSASKLLGLFEQVGSLEGEELFERKRFKSAGN
jgi:hypothetical protein